MVKPMTIIDLPMSFISIDKLFMEKKGVPILGLGITHKYTSGQFIIFGNFFGIHYF